MGFLRSPWSSQNSEGMNYSIENKLYCLGLQKEKSCGHPGNPENGKTIIQNNLLYLSKVNFTCNDGYRLIGSPSAQCRLKGNAVKWNQELPNCEQITCVSPPNISHGTYNGSNGTFAYHSTITYKCDDGFSLTGDASLYCITENQIDGIWDRSAPECRRNCTPQGVCSSPERIENAVLRSGELQDSYPVGTNLTYRCIPGYQLISGTVPQITCSNASQWLPETPQFCEGQRCMHPDIENGRIISVTDMRLGDEITFACNIGYRLIGENTARCTLKFNKVDWNYIPTCQRIPCLPPPNINNGRVSGGTQVDYDYGAAVTYSCDSGYSLIGKKNLVCRVAADGVNGEWDSPPPECKVVSCRRPNIIHGSISAFRPLYTYDHTLVITCDAGYSLLGANLIKCGADNNWDPPIPTCVFDTIATTVFTTVHTGGGSAPDTTTITISTTVPSGDGTTSGPTKSPKDKPASTKAPKDQPGSSSNLGIVVGCVIGLLLLVIGVGAGVLCNRANHKKGKMDTSTSTPDAYVLVPQKTDDTVVQKNTVLQEKKEPSQV